MRRHGSNLGAALSRACALALCLWFAFARDAWPGSVPAKAPSDTSFAQRALGPWPVPPTSSRWEMSGGVLERSSGGSYSQSFHGLSPQASTPDLAYDNVELPSADGNVLSMARSGGTLYLAGAFRTIGGNLGGFALLDANHHPFRAVFPYLAAPNLP